MVRLAAFGLGYAAGSITAGFVVGRAFGVDLRIAGTGNVGASNLARLVGFWPSFLAFVVDVGKALLVMWLVSDWDSSARVAAGLGLIVGHGWPIWLGFVGGRGQAVTLAAGLVLAPFGTLAILPILGIGLFASRLALSGLVAMTLYPLAALLLDGTMAAAYALGATVLAVAHRLRASPGVRRAPLRQAWQTRLLHDREP
ncbi:MAG: glycerol-3-phosphate acyltransferase [Acidimicrobiia bacterium]